MNRIFALLRIVLLISLASSVQAQTALVVLAHPDDEMSINGTIRHLVTNAVDVHVAYTTSGKYGRDVRYPENQQPTPEELAATREQESVDALGVLGVVSSNIHFLRLDNVSADLYQITSPIQQLFDSVQPALVITFGPEGVYGHVDHKTVSSSVSYVFNNASVGKVLLYLAISESKDQGYGFTVGKGTPDQGYNVQHVIKDYAINYQQDVAAYTSLRKTSASYYVSQYLATEMALIHNHYENAMCNSSAGPFLCEQYVLARIKRNLNNDVSDIMGLITLAN